jgi:DNA-binding NtrC family response regulator
MQGADAVVARAAQACVPLVLIGDSPAARRLADEIRSAREASCVLIESEGGLDPVDVARAVHDGSGRRGRFIAIECGGAEPAVVERELFGELPRRAGGDLESIAPRSALAEARGGTLYLGDLPELSAAAQARLARVARDREARIGSGAAARLDACLIGSTSTDAEAEVTEGRLRRDLLRHLSRTRIAVPGLRRRAEDLPSILQALTARLCVEAGAAEKTYTPAAVTLLAAMPWRGNLVELRHAVSRLITGSASGVIQLEDVLAHVRFDGALAPHAPAGTLRSARQQFEREYIALVLRHHRGRVGDAARALGIQRTNLYRKARQLGIRLRQRFGETAAHRVNPS